MSTSKNQSSILITMKLFKTLGGELFRSRNFLFSRSRTNFLKIDLQKTNLKIFRSHFLLLAINATFSFRVRDFYQPRSNFFVADIFYRSQTLLDFFSISFLSLSNDHSLSKSRKIYITNPNSNS